MKLDRNRFGVLGGDRRQKVLAESLAGDGYSVLACGFEQADLAPDVQKASFQKTVSACGVLLLPLPITRDGKTLRAVYADAPIALDEAFVQGLRGHRVFGGMTARACALCPKLQKVEMQDYAAQEDFALRNAAVTAEGALLCALQEYPGTICGSRCLVVGCGRIGSQLAPRLRALGATVSVTYRRAVTAAAITAMGCRAVPAEALGEGGAYDMVFHTAPAQLFTPSVLAAFPRGTLLIDLSSAPGGVDRAAAESRGICAIQAFSLPAKVAPHTAGEILKETILQMMKE